MGIDVAASDWLSAQTTLTSRQIEKVKKQLELNPQDNEIQPWQEERYKSLDELSQTIEEKLKELFEKYNLPVAQLTRQQLEDLISMNGKKLNATQFAKELQRLVLMACYTYQPALRADWSTLKLTNRLREIPDHGNWLYFSRKPESWRIVMQGYKNARSMGKTEIQINAQLAKLLAIWFGVLRALKPDADYLFLWNFSEGEATHVGARNSLAKRTPRVFESMMGTPLTVNDLRHIHESELQRSEDYQHMNQRQREKAHKQLLHSQMTGLQYNLV